MPAVRSIRSIPSFVWIPPIYESLYKIEIVSSGTTYDITDDIISGEYTDGITETIGNFTFTFDNSEGEYSNKFSLNDEIKIYSDYATSATTLRFLGVIEKVNSKEEEITVSGGSGAIKVMGTSITKNYINTYTHDILIDLINTYFSGIITYTNIDTTESTDLPISVNWYQKPFWECVLEVCNRAGRDAYIDASYDFHYFNSESIENTTEAVVHDFNLIEVGDFTPDSTNIKNRVIVYGAIIEEQQIMWTEEDQDSIDDYGLKELIINDTNIITVEQARDRAVYELSINKDPPIIGEVISDPLATILPGERIRLSDPESGINPSFYNIPKFTQKFGDDEETILTIQKEQSTISKILKSRITFESQYTEKENPNEMRFSWLFPFDADSGTHTNTQITDGSLRVIAGQSSGTWISETNIISDDIEIAEIRMSGIDLNNVTAYLSTDAGYSYQEFTGLKTPLTLSPSGTSLKLKIEISAVSTEIKSLVVLYKT